MTLLLTRGRSTGGGSALPSGYLAAEFLEATTAGTSITFPALLSSDGHLIEVKTEHYIAPGAGFRAEGSEYLAWGCYQTNIYYKAQQGWAKGSIQPNAWNVIHCIFENTIITAIQGNEIYEEEKGVAKSSNLVMFFEPSFKQALLGKKRYLNITVDGKAVRQFIPALTPEGEPCMYDKVNKETFTNSGSGQFIVGMTCKQALKLAELPSTGGTLTVSLPWEAQLDYDVYDALQTAKANGWTITVQYRDAEPDSAVYNKYATCKTVADIAAINPNFRTDLTADGGWIYPLPELTNLANLAWGGNYSPDMPVKYVDCDAPKVKSTNPGFVHNCQPKWARGDWSGVENGMWMFGAVAGKVLSNVEMVFPKLQIGNEMFGNAILNKESVLRILDSIPSYTSGMHILTIGIHVDHEFDEEIVAAIADAEAKGWTIAEQWNGTATAKTASTWGLRRKPIYAKVSEYDGERYLSWGHYVTNWEENGYQEFASVDEAKEHFNIGD